MGGGVIERLLIADIVELVVWIAIVAALVAVAIYVIGKVRASPAQHEPTVSQLMSKFRELHSRGKLSDAEFRTIKTMLGTQLREELKDNGEKGYDK